jgi:hypothetical protein
LMSAPALRLTLARISFSASFSITCSYTVVCARQGSEPRVHLVHSNLHSCLHKKQQSGCISNAQVAMKHMVLTAPALRFTLACIKCSAGSASPAAHR